MNGSEFVRLYAQRGLPAWEAAALQLARQNELTPWPWIDLPLTNGTDTVILQVQSDVLSIGPLEDSLRLPLTPRAAQNIFNLYGWLLPTATYSAAKSFTWAKLNIDEALGGFQTQIVGPNFAANASNPGFGTRVTYNFAPGFLPIRP